MTLLKKIGEWREGMGKKMGGGVGRWKKGWDKDDLGGRKEEERKCNNHEKENLKKI